MSKKKRIALITIWFPPKSGVAVNRMHAFAKYLAADYQIEVFTEGDKNRSEELENFTVHYLASDSFLNTLKHKTDDNWFRHNFISVVNVTKGFLGYSTLKKWVKNSSQALLDRHEKNPFDLIISSFSPFESHLVALDFVKKSRLPWIADMRDEMSKNPFASNSERKQLLRQEKEIGKYATAVTSVSYPILDDFKKLLPQITHFEEIRNGFDHDFIFEAPAKNKVFTIGYFGIFYGQRKPDTFFKALGNLKEHHGIAIKVEIVGAHKTFHIPNNLVNDVSMFPPLKYIDAVNSMSKMDANLLVHPAGMHKGVYTGKLFDYISVGKPVIGVIDTQDVAAELIREFDCGYIADFYDVAEIETAILEAYRDWENNVVRGAKRLQIETLHRKNEVKKLSNLITELLEQ